MNKKSRNFAIFYLSLCLVACAIVVVSYRAKRLQGQLIARKFCYRYHVVDSTALSDKVLLVATEALAKQTVDFYNIKGNATFIGEIKATLNPFTRVDVIGYGQDSSIVRVRVVYRNSVHNFFSSTIGYVPKFTLFDTIPKNKLTYSQYSKELRQKNHIQDSIDSISSHINTTQELNVLRTITAEAIKSIEIHGIDYNTQQMANIDANEFKAGSKYDYYNIYNRDSINSYLVIIRKVLRFNARNMNLKNSAHYGGLTIHYDKNKSIYYSFDRSYTQVGDSVYSATNENAYFIKNALIKRHKQAVTK